jgi:hypothetical protein
MAKTPSNPFCMPYPDKSGPNQYQIRYLNPPDLSTGCLVDERRINMGNPGLNFLIHQIQFVVIFFRAISAIRVQFFFVSFCAFLWLFSFIRRDLSAYGGLTR